MNLFLNHYQRLNAGKVIAEHGIDAVAKVEVDGSRVRSLKRALNEYQISGAPPEDRFIRWVDAKAQQVNDYQVKRAEKKKNPPPPGSIRAKARAVKKWLKGTKPYQLLARFMGSALPKLATRSDIKVTLKTGEVIHTTEEVEDARLTLLVNRLSLPSAASNSIPGFPFVPDIAAWVTVLGIGGYAVAAASKGDVTLAMCLTMLTARHALVGVSSLLAYVGLIGLGPAMAYLVASGNVNAIARLTDKKPTVAQMAQLSDGEPSA